MKRWLTAADIRREIVTGLQAWFEQTDNTLEVAAAEDTGEDDPDDKDSDTDSDYNSIDDDDDDEGQPHP
jgi:hypothetical protein